MAGNITTCKNYALLKSLGLVLGDTDTMESEWLKSFGATAEQVNDQWMQVFKAGGAASDQWNVAAFEWLGIQGAIGNDLPLRWQDYWCRVMGGNVWPGSSYNWLIGNSGTFYGYRVPGHPSGAFGDLDPANIQGIPVYVLEVDTATDLITLDMGVNGGEQIGTNTHGILDVVGTPSITLAWDGTNYVTTDAVFTAFVQAADGTTLEFSLVAIDAPYVPTPPPASVDSDLVTYLQFNEHTISTAYLGQRAYVGVRNSVRDSSGTNNHGTPPNQEMFADQVGGHALGNWLVFTGAEVVTLPAMTAETGSIEIWVNPGNVAAAQLSLVETTGLLLELNASGQASLTVNASNVTFLADLSDGNDHYIVGKWGVGGMSIIVDDGTPVTDIEAGTLTATTDDWTIGGPTNGYVGSVLSYALHKVQISAADITTRYAAGAGLPITVGPTIDTFETSKMIYKPDENPSFTLDVTNDQNYVDAHVNVVVTRGLDESITVYGETVQLVTGAQSIPFIWWMVSNGLDNNKQGHIATVTIRDSGGVTIAEAVEQFDVVDELWKSQRLALFSVSDWAFVGGKTESEILDRINLARGWGISAIELFKYAPPFIMNPPGSTWDNVQYETETERSKVEFWGTELAARGMLYVAYNETPSIKYEDDGITLIPETWKLLKTSTLGDYYITIPGGPYDLAGYVAPNLPSVATANISDSLLSAIDAFGFNGIYCDGAYQLGVISVKPPPDGKFDSTGIQIEGNPYTRGGDWGADWFGPVVTAVHAGDPDFFFYCNNYWPIASPALGDPIETIYANIEATVAEQNSTVFSDIHEIGTYEGDSSEIPSTAVFNEYSKMLAGLSAIKDLVGPMLMWAWITRINKTNALAFSRPKMANYLASGWTMSDKFSVTDGMLSWSDRYAADSQVYAQYLSFWARYSDYLQADDWVYIRTPLIPGFQVTASRPLFWDYSVWERTNSGLKEYVIHVQNHPSNDTIEDQSEIPAIATNVLLQVPTDLGENLFDVFVLDADTKALIPVEVVTEGDFPPHDDPIGIRYFNLPDILAYSVIVLRESATAAPALNTIFEDTFTDTDGTNITAHVADTAPVGTVWEVLDGTGVITNNRLYGNTAATNNHLIHDIKITGPVEISAIINIDSSVVNTQGFIFKVQDGNNFWLAGVVFSSDVIPELRLNSVENGTHTVRASTLMVDEFGIGVGPLPAGEYKLTVKIDGANMDNPANRNTVTLDYLGIHYEASSALSILNTATKIGVRIYGTAGYADDLKVVE